MDIKTYVYKEYLFGFQMQLLKYLIRFCTQCGIQDMRTNAV